MQELIIEESEEIAKIIYTLITSVKSSLVDLNKTVKYYSYLIMILEIGLFYSNKQHTYPVLGNRRAGSFAEKYQAKWNQSIRTKTQLMHFIKGFGLEDYVQYQDCRVAGEFPGKKETYSMNLFITDEFRNREAQDKLVLF